MSRTTPARERSPKARPSAAGWARFQRNLTAVLDGLAPEQFLVVSSKRGNRFVQFVKSPPKKGASELRAEAVSNAYLGKSRRLRTPQLAAMSKLGWNSPTYAPGEPRDPAGSSRTTRTATSRCVTARRGSSCGSTTRRARRASSRRCCSGRS